MPTTRNLIALFRALGEKDFKTAILAAHDVCTAEESRGHPSSARTLRGALQGQNVASVLPYHDALGNGLVQLTPTVGLDGLVLTKSLRTELDLLVQEWKCQNLLKTSGLAPSSRILFFGPPGCGKSAAASAIAAELGWPIYLARFDTIIGSYLGQTAVNLRQLFAFVEQRSCILLLDELDALGKKRGNLSDVGELDRIVIALMQELEHSKPRGLIIATTNLEKNLDRALWRRFDNALEFKSPTRQQIEDFCKSLEEASGIKLSSLRSAMAAKNFADAEALVRSALRRKIIGASKTNG